MKPIRIATRASQLALWQANTVASRLRAAHPDREIDIVEITTMGDAIQDRRLAELPDTGVFTKQVDQAVLDDRADLGVHSLKDQITDLDPRLLVAAVLERGPVEDALVLPSGSTATSLENLPRGARVATGSLRRAAQLRRQRSDLEIVDIRGNVDGRLAKLDAGHADAMVLACAGLERMGLGARIAEVLPQEAFRPAVSQGIVAMVCRSDDADTGAVLAAIDDEPTSIAARAERAFLHALQGGCNVPAGVTTTLMEGRVRLEARVLGMAGTPCLEDVAEGPSDDPETLGRDLALRMRSHGAASLIDELRA